MKTEKYLNYLSSIEKDLLLGVKLLAEEKNEDDLYNSAFRYAIFSSLGDKKYFRNLANLWKMRGCKTFKKSELKIKLHIISDITTAMMDDYLKLFLSSYGIAADISYSDFDSVEKEVYENHIECDFLIMFLSDSWLQNIINKRRINEKVLNEVFNYVNNLLVELNKKYEIPIFLNTFYDARWHVHGSFSKDTEILSQSTFNFLLNSKILKSKNKNIKIFNTDDIIRNSGGINSIGGSSFLKMRSSFNEFGFINLSRDLASLIANYKNKSHRAIILDLDNTLWGGEIGDLGKSNIILGQETSEGFGYQLIQDYLKQISHYGILLAISSKNDQKIFDVFDKNNNCILKKDDFSSVQINWDAKSVSVGRIQEDFNFGTDLMLFMDDDYMNLIDVSVNHPEIDIIHASKFPEISLDKISRSKYFNFLDLTKEDLDRKFNQSILIKQNKLKKNFNNYDDFLNSLDVKIIKHDFNKDNKERVVQLINKTNQFNLTSKRYNLSDIENMQDEKYNLGIFEYTDKFGSQGIISIVILKEENNVTNIDTWLMSCRVLNRKVEYFVYDWIKSVAKSKIIKGRYFPTEKNKMVKDFYTKMGFNKTESENYYEVEI